jgi:hypothetical protein
MVKNVLRMWESPLLPPEEIDGNSRKISSGAEAHSLSPLGAGAKAPAS